MNESRLPESAKPDNPEVVAFLLHGMTSIEQQWPRFVPRFRSMHGVTMGELRTHPDLLGLLKDLAPPFMGADLHLLMGAAVLVASSGTIYALAYSQNFLAVRLPAPADAEFRAHFVQWSADASPGVKRAHQSTERLSTLGADWVITDAWSPNANTILRRAIASARMLAESSGREVRDEG